MKKFPSLLTDRSSGIFQGKPKFFFAALTGLLLSNCKVYHDHGVEVLAPVSSSARPPQEMLAAIDHLLRERGYSVSHKRGTRSLTWGKESRPFTAVNRYRRHGGGEMITYQGPEGRVAYEKEFTFIPPWQFPSAEYHEANRAVWELTQTKTLGYAGTPARFTPKP